MALARITAVGGTSFSGLTVAAPTDAILPAGTLVVVLVVAADAGVTLSSVTDDSVNEYTEQTGHVNIAGNDGYSATAYAILATQLEIADNITATFSAGTASSIDWIAYSGAAAAPLDQQNFGQDDAFPQTGTLNSGDVTTTQNDEVLVGLHWYLDSMPTWTATADFAKRHEGNGPSETWGTLIEDRIVSATGTYASTPTVSPNGYWNSHILTFKAAGAAPPAGDTTTRRYQIRRSRMTSW